MRRWFLSYHSPDEALAERLKAALERKDTDAHVFFADGVTSLPVEIRTLKTLATATLSRLASPR
jgi:Trk K+ transport system NAD-binding subunit